MDAFDQMYEIVTAFHDDKFVSVLKVAGEERKALAKAKKAHDERETDLSRREKLASVVLNSQQTFNSQHDERMTKLKAAEDSLAGKKKLLGRETAAAKADLKVEEDRLKVWSDDLTRDQNEAAAILKTKDKAAKDAKKAAADKAHWEARVTELGLKVA